MNYEESDYIGSIEEIERQNSMVAEIEKATMELKKAIAEAKTFKKEQDTLKALQADVAQIKAQTGERPLTKDEIMAVKDTHKRLKLIRENPQLFSDMLRPSYKSANELAEEAEFEQQMRRYGVTSDMSINEILKRMPDGRARVYALNKAMKKAR